VITTAITRPGLAEIFGEVDPNTTWTS